MNRLITNLNGGFTLIETTIVMAAISIFLAGAYSWLGNHAIRTKIDEVLPIADSAKKAIIVTCTEDPTITTLTNSLLGHEFPTSLYVKGVTLSGSCSSPVITVNTVNTGLLIDPTLTITGDNLVGNGQLSWICASDGLDIHVPDTCQS